MRFSIAIACALLALVTLHADASSHSEAPGTVTSPRSDIVDLYAFRSYETGRDEYTTLILNVNPLQETFGGPNYSPLPSDFVFNIHIDNTGDAVEDVTFQFVVGANFTGDFDASKGIHEGFKLDIGGRMVKIPLAHFGPVAAADGDQETTLNYKEHYRMRVVSGPTATSANTNVDNGPFAAKKGTSDTTFRKPFDYAGTKTFPDYAGYASKFYYNFDFPASGVTPAAPATCTAGTVTNKVFVGQRADPFVVNLGEVFDLVKQVPVVEAPFSGTSHPTRNMLRDKAVTSFVVEVHNSCIQGSAIGSVIGVWGSVQHLTHVGPSQIHTAGAQKNRLGNPLVNEVLIGLTDKNTFNSQHPSKDRDFLEYFEYPTLPALINILWGQAVRDANVGVTGMTSIAPSKFPRADIRDTLLQGLPGINENKVLAGSEDASCTPPIVAGANGPLADMLRLNLATPATAVATQHRLGVVAGDNAGFPNGRRPGDDVVDIMLNVAMGHLCQAAFSGFNFCTPADAPVAGFTITDRVDSDPGSYPAAFPYLNVPKAGSDFRCGVTCPV